MKIKVKNKTLITIILVLSISLSPVAVPKTHAFWGEFVQENYHFLLKKIDDTIRGTILSTLKKQAMKMITGQMEKLMGGGGKGGARFITDWKAYIIKNPKDETKVYMNDYLSQITKGKGSQTGYIAAGSKLLGGAAKGATPSTLKEGFGASNGGSYSSQLVNMAKATVVDPKTPQVTYEGDPSQMFAGKNFKNMNNYFSGINNPWAFQMNAAAEKKKKDEENIRVATAKAIAYSGVKGVGEDDKGKGTITMPGSLVKDIAANAQDLGNKILAGATHPEEILTAMVTQMMNKAMQMGIGQVQKMVGKEIGGMVGGKLNDLVKKEGPGAIFKTVNRTSGTVSGASSSKAK